MALQKKKPAPRKRKRTSKNVNVVRTIWRAVILLLVVVAFAATGYFFGYVSGKKENGAALQAQLQQNHFLKSALKRAQEDITAAHEYAPAKEPKPPKREKDQGNVVEAPVGTKPMLAIIFDDVSFAHEVRSIKGLGMTVTMSFFPPSNRHPNSAKLANKQPFYMVHLPLQAVAYSNEEPDTLHVGDSREQIDARVRQIKEIFPRVHFVNNHTGSKFTADMPSMKMLIHALDSEGITFIDSRTTAETAVPAIMKSLGRPYISRDVFLDDDPSVDAIKKQIARAVKIAKKYGYAIAIGHPHKGTIKALGESRALLSQVDLVRIDTLVAHIEK
jgi:uncharacterized protein